MAATARSKRDFLRLTDLDRSGLLELVEQGATWKRLGKGGPRPLQGTTIGLVFEKASTRTRVSFEVAAHQLGGNAIFLSPRDMQLGRGEPIQDTARCLARYLDALVVRTFEHHKLEEIARFSDVPVINALSDACHPCQLLADLLTVAERFGLDALSRPGLQVAWVGDGYNMANSWVEACSLLGFELVLACPQGYDPDAALLEQARPEVIALHCLPAHRGEEISDGVIEGPRSAIFDQAENRLHAQKALLELLLAPR